MEYLLGMLKLSHLCDRVPRVLIAAHRPSQVWTNYTFHLANSFWVLTEIHIFLPSIDPPMIYSILRRDLLVLDLCAA